ncbi:MAG: patatin, partial [Thermoanaerobaculia bacterium]
MNRAEAPSRYCDLVMKGGVTSGIVYPLAITELSKVFRLKNIGGTSAAAIAAAAAAAAEYRRCATGGDRSGFDTLEDLPAFLGGSPAGMTGTRLLHFFQPRPGARRLFNTVVAAFGASDGALRKGLLAAARNFWPFLLAGSLPGIAALTLAVMSPPSGLAWVAGLLGVVVAAVGAMLAVSVTALRVLLVDVPSNFFGLTTGMRGAPSAAQP